jgi:hypothetical protein
MGSLGVFPHRARNPSPQFFTGVRVIESKGTQFHLAKCKEQDMLPKNAEFLAAISYARIDNNSGLSIAERQLLLTLVRLFFGPAQQAGAVRDVSEPESLAELAASMHRPGERFDQLERQTSLPEGFFSSPYSRPGAAALYVATQENIDRPPSYFLYESSENIVLYVGPDFLHELPDQTVINCMRLDSRFRPTESHTLRTH